MIMRSDEIEDIEVKMVCEAIFRRHGVDLRNYSCASLRRQLLSFLATSSYKSISELLPPILHDEKFFFSILPRLLISVTEMFRDPSFFLEFKNRVIPILKTYPFIKIWHAGCASGEEVYSMAILLKEAGLLNKTTLYGTDINNVSLKKALEGIFSLEEMKSASKRYISAGGIASLSDYYTDKYELARMHEDLKENTVFSNHNLVHDGVFGEMHVILCRNVSIYFNKELQNNILKLFSNSLINRGFLCIGPKESLEFLSEGHKFELISSKEKIFKKKENIVKIMH